MDTDTKACDVCGESIKAVALKCRFCSTDLEAFANARALRTEREIFSGHPVVIYSVYQAVPYLVALGIAVVILSQTHSGIGAFTTVAVFLLLCSVFSLKLFIDSRRRRFQITTQRIRIEYGLFSKVQESLEVFRIDHFELRRPLGMRLLSQARLHVFSSDAELSNFNIYGVPSLSTLAEQLRECQLQQRTLHAVTFVKA